MIEVGIMHLDDGIDGNVNTSVICTDDDDEEKETLLGRDTIVLGNLHPKKRGDWSPARSPKDQTIECDIQPSDTLQTLALKVSFAAPSSHTFG